jgi:hypothetical protein
LGHSCFQKKAFRFLGTVFGANWAHGMSLFGAFFFSDKMDRRFSGVPMRQGMPFYSLSESDPDPSSLLSSGSSKFPHDA